jgi:hypothetical protein
MAEYWEDQVTERRCCGNLFWHPKESKKESEMAKNHYVTKAKRRNRSGKRKDTKRIAANMAKIRQLEKASSRTAS